MKLTDFNYYLPKHLIAQRPLPYRDQSKLLVMDRKSGQFEDSTFKQLLNYLLPDDTLVLNETKVIPARLFGLTPSGRRIEVLIHSPSVEGLWQALIKPVRKAKDGLELTFSPELFGQLMKDNQKGWWIRFRYSGDFLQILNRSGQMPIPPYIKRKSDEEDNHRYQTIYATKQGAIAAPTAGLHFTQQILDHLKQKGINLAYLTLHVGIATFKPIKTAEIEDHQITREYYSIPQETANIINQTKGRVIAVGTTTVRALESAPLPDQMPEKGERLPLAASLEGWTELFIYPGYRFKVIDGLLTNFHLPCSTLLVLVSAFAGRENIMAAYEYAIKQQYRFYSYGDAMLIL